VNAVDVTARGLARRALDDHPSSADLAGGAGADLIGKGQATVGALLPLTPQEYGATADGVAVDQAALESAIAGAREQARAAIEAFPGQIGGSVHLPPGDYLMTEVIALVAPQNGQPCASLRLTATPGTVRIRVPDGQYAFETAERVIHLYVEGITFQGGKGAFRQSYSGVNVNSYRTFVNCYFLDYTECAVASNASDNPYWKFIECYFRGADGYDTRGIALTGLLDDLRIEGCTFTRDQYHLVLGPLASAGYVVFNSFLSFTAEHCDADVVLVPNDAAGGYGVNAGEGLTFGWNKFGNENLSEAAPRILIAKLAADGDGVENHTVDTAWTVGTGGANYIFGVQFKGNTFIFDGAYNAPLIRSYVDQVGNLLIDDDNRFMGGQATYLVEWMGPHSYDYTLGWDVRLSHYGLHKAFGVPFSLGLSNCPIGPVKMGTLAPGAELPHGPLGCDERTLAYCAGEADWSLGSGAGGKVAMIGPRGTNTAAEVTVVASNSVVLYKQFDATGQTDRTAWIVLQLKKHDIEPVKRVRVQLYNFGDNVVAHDRYHVLDPKWGQLVEPVMIPETPQPAKWQLRVYAADCVPGSQDKLLAGRLHVHTGSSPMASPPAAYQPDATGSYAAPSGGTTVDAEGRTALAQLATDMASLRTKLNALLAQARADGRMKLV
jgi:hypothetical protein